MNFTYNQMRILFEPKSVAIFGATPKAEKVGNVILRNFIDKKYDGKIYPINPKYKTVFGLKCYNKISEIKECVDLSIFAIPSKYIPQAFEEAAKRKTKGAIIISGGFKEAGHPEYENMIKKISKKYHIPVVGPNCLGVLDPYTNVDSIFLPMYKMQRPPRGSISFITQSGAVAACVVDIVANYGIGLSRFISYGNAAVLNENDFLEFLENDKRTETIIMYLEGASDGRELLKIMRRVSRKKPIIALKSGRSKKSGEAAHSHTGNLAGNYLAYKAAFRQSKVIEAKDLDELFDFVRIFNQPLLKGKRIGIITDGGGLGVLSTDSIVENNMEIAPLTKDMKNKLKKILPFYASIKNPLDMAADAGYEEYMGAVEIFMNDVNIDMLIIIVLFQAPAVDERILNMLIRYSSDRRKPIAVIASGGAYTEMYKKILEANHVPTYGSPSGAVKAIKKLYEYSMYRKDMTKHPNQKK